MIDHQPTTCQKFYRQQGARRPGDIISYRRATSSRNQRATSSESAVIEDLGRGDRGLAVIQLGEGDLGIGVDEGLLIDPPDALQRADIEGVLGAAITGTLALELAIRLL